MRRFIDLSVKAIDIETVTTAKSLGYSAIGLSQEPMSNGIDIVKRLDLEPKNANDLLNNLRRNRWNTEVIVVNCKNKSVARQAGKDRRVDLITYPIIEDWNRNYLDRHQANLMKEVNSGYLIDLSKLFVADPQTLKKRINFLKENTKNALKHDLPVVASSFAENAMGLRDPLGLAALLTLLDIKEEQALNMISIEPYRIVENNRAKLKDSYIAQGVWVIKDE